ncbi:MAG TPA: 50S ribosomal protein L11 methyltransferase [Roseiarcus sp.]|nr:50S ribosomal protein L11 methyltransferase [Roseiarcus sp.]
MLEGLPPNNAAHRLRLVCDETRARAIVDLIVESFEPAEAAASAFESEAGAPDKRDWIVEAYFGFEPDRDALRNLIAAAAGEEAAGRIEFSGMAEADWVANSLAGLAPVKAGRFLIHGGHDRARVRPNDIAIEIEAALAFGTGHHGTTRGCLLLFERVLRRRRPARILDIGCGTGVLAIAAAKALRRPAAAGDIDPVAVATAAANARLNGAGELVRPVVSRGAERRELRQGGPYDLIFANILARPLRRLAPSLAALTAPRGEAIVSGLLAADVAGVLSSWRAQGFRLVQRLDLEGWASLLLCRA